MEEKVYDVQGASAYGRKEESGAFYGVSPQLFCAFDSLALAFPKVLAQQNS